MVSPLWAPLIGETKLLKIMRMRHDINLCRLAVQLHLGMNSVVIQFRRKFTANNFRSNKRHRGSQIPKPSSPGSYQNKLDTLVHTICIWPSGLVLRRMKMTPFPTQYAFYLQNTCTILFLLDNTFIAHINPFFVNLKNVISCSVNIGSKQATNSRSFR